MGAARFRVCRHYRHVARWSSQMVGLGHGAYRLGSVACLRNRLQQTWLHRDELDLDHDTQSQHDCVAQTRLGFNDHRSCARTYRCVSAFSFR